MASYEQMGYDPLPVFITGLSWKAQLAKRIYDETGDAKLKAFFGEHNWNVKLIEKLTALATIELAPGADRVLAMSARSGVTKATIQSFLRNVNKFREKTTTESAVSLVGGLASKTIKGTGNILEGAGKLGLTVPFVVGVLAVGIGGYMLLAGKKGVNLVPSFKFPSLK